MDSSSKWNYIRGIQDKKGTNKTISFVINAMQFLFRMEDVDDHMYRERGQLQQIVTTDLELRFFLVLMAGHAFSCCD
ncbi:hypothetical protein IscW_ISCW011401 [Ixodes scapularis]|uniref:Uncharacterized protein n=1 Tax=Ixodes scapularis TaxID=6945 RepID=B7Q565_IXOSC|nr:hypothetical protein IscW_ISCW011401 [Ixodes scapularis]|eukprot:XP_002411695.1 hypothetical protein IscW_ISCW011401 [Ixodes scapularis]